MTFPMYKTIHIIQLISCLLSQTTNFFLLYLIWTKARRVLGTYRYLMGTFSIYAIVYNYVDIITQPLVLIERQMYVVVNHGILRNTPVIGFLFTCMFGASFGLCISLLSTQFFYRYLAVCRPTKLIHVEGYRIILLFVPAMFVCITWFLNCYFGLAITPTKQEILRIPFMEEYGEDSSTMAFVGGMYWTVDSNGERHWSLPDCIGSMGLAALMTICCSTIVYCGVETYKKMNDAGNSMSERTKELNRQLFITLSLQTLLPFVLMYGPVGLLFLLPFFEANIGFLASSAAASTAIYPALEPLIAIFCIKSFRNTLICYRNKNKVSSTGVSIVQ